MASRELRVVSTGRTVGKVADDPPLFEGHAAVVFARARTDRGDDLAARELITEGWSNGYLYLA